MKHTTHASHTTHGSHTTHESHTNHTWSTHKPHPNHTPFISIPHTNHTRTVHEPHTNHQRITHEPHMNHTCLQKHTRVIASAMQPSLLRGRGAMICSKDGYLYLSVHVIVIEGVKPTCMEGIFDEDEVPESSDVIALHLRLAGRRRCEAQGAKLVERRTPSLLRGYAWRKIYCGAMNRMRDVLLKGARPVSRPEPRRQRAALGEKLHGKLGSSGDRSSDCKPE